MENIITFKIPYYVENEQEKCIVLDFIKQYNSVLHFTYNRLFENSKLKTKEITVLQKSLNHIDLIDSHFKNSSIYDAKIILSSKNKNEKIIFGGKRLFKERLENKISKKEFKIKRLNPLTSIGEANQKANRKFEILTDSQILFKPCRDIHICLNLQSLGKKRAKELRNLIALQNNKQIAITYQLTLDFIYLTFDYNKIKENTYEIKENRILSLDLNPNFIGLSVIDWLNSEKYNILYKEVISNKPLNDLEKLLHCASNDNKKLYIKNKRDFEIIQIAYRISTLCKHFKCEICCIEDLNIKSKNLDKGRTFNRLVNNQWNRNKFINTLRKLLICSSTKLIEIEPSYSSFIGNLVYRDEQLPDMILASIELSRRAYEFNLQYIKKSKIPQKNIIFPKLEMVKDKISKSLEELKIESHFETLQELYLELKKSNKKYRFLLEDLQSSRVFSKNYFKRYQILYTFE